MSSSPGHSVFISYSSTDEAIARAVLAALEGEGVRCWIASRDITPGIQYAEALVDAIDASRVFVLVFSSAAARSPQVLREVDRACGKGLTIVTFRVDDTPMSKKWEFYLATQQWLNAFPLPFDAYLDQLADSVRRLLEPIQPSPRLTASPPPRLFLSFTQEAEQYSEDLRWDLLQAGAVVMSSDPHQALEYRTADREVEAIHECDCFVAVVSDTYEGSPSCRLHLDALRHEFGGLGPRKRVFVVRMGRAPLPAFLQSRAWIGISGHSASEDARRLLSALSGQVSVAGVRAGAYWAGPGPSASAPLSQRTGPEPPEAPPTTQPERLSTVQLLADGVGPRVEFRAIAQRSEGIVRTLTRFMNAEGGTLLLGVDPMGTVVGLERSYAAMGTDGLGFAQWLTDSLERTFGRQALAAAQLGLSTEKIGGHRVLRIDVSPSRN